MWFTEDPWPPIAMCLIPAMICLADWVWRQRTWMLITCIGLSILSGVIFVIEGAIVTPGEEVEQRVEDLAVAFQRQDLKQTLGFISPNNIQFNQRVRSGMAMIQSVERLRITGLVVEQQEGNRLMSDFRANGRIVVTGAGDLGNRPTRWQLTWEREEEDGQWKIVGVTRLNPITGEEMGVLSAR
jgi:hypothetical protein